MARRKRIPYDPPHLRKKRGRPAPPATPSAGQTISRRMLFAKGAVLGAFGLLAARLGVMQIVEGAQYRAQAVETIRRPQTLPATRGLVFDRAGRKLADNRQTWEVRVRPGDLPEDAEDRRRVLDTLINALNLPDALVLDPKDVPDGAVSAVYTRTAQLLGKVLAVEPTEQWVQYPFFKVGDGLDEKLVPGRIVRVNGQELYVFVYPDVASRKSGSARISGNGRLIAGNRIDWPDRPNFSAQGNVLALLLSGDDRLAFRVDRAIASLPKDAVSTEDAVLTALRNDAFAAWSTYIEDQARVNYLVNLEDDLSTDQAALCRAHLNELPGAKVMNRLEYLVENGRSMERVVVKTGVPREIALKLEANRHQLPGLEVDGGVLLRRYPGGDALSHVLGYVGSVNQEELKQNLGDDKQPLYDPEDVIGKDGLELKLERLLRGRRGWETVEMDLTGSSWRVLDGDDMGQPPIAGKHVALTIDLEFQRATSDILREGIAYSNADRQMMAAADPNRTFKKESGAGAVVALDPKTGEILAMVSFPHYDNQLFVDGISKRKYEEYVSAAANKPLLDRAVRGEYPPGSTLKPFLAVSALQDKKITPETTYLCAGAIRVPYAWDESKGNTHPCWIWRSGGHRDLNVVDAIEQSCDIFFYNVGAPEQPVSEGSDKNLHYRDYDMGSQQIGREEHFFEGLGIEAIKKYLTEQFWFGQATGIDLAVEAEGLVPDAEQRERVRPGAGWSVGDTIITSIGQGDFLATPLQMALNTAAIANGGSVPKPILVRETYDDARTAVEAAEPSMLRKLGFAKEHMDVAREGMRRVVHGEMGSARANVDGSSKWALVNGNGEPEILIGGKTGTAEIGVPDENGIYQQQHAWFTCFAPFDDPEIAVAVLVEDGGEGSAYAVPVAERVVRAWFEISGTRPRGTVLRTDGDPTVLDQSPLAETAAFPQPGAFGTSVPVSQD